MVVRSLIATVVIAACATPALASSVIHSANSEMGYTSHPDHAQSGKSRSEVLAEIDQSRKDGSWAYHRLGAPLPAKSAGQPLTREQVLADLERARNHPSWSVRRVGGAVSMP